MNKPNNIKLKKKKKKKKDYQTSLLTESFVQEPLGAKVAGGGGVSHCPPFSGGSSLSLKTLFTCEPP